MTYAWPILLLAIPLVPLGALVLWVMGRRRAARVAAFGHLNLAPSATGRRAAVRRKITAAFYLLGLMLLAFSLARPTAVVSLPVSEGLVILAFDVSQSMAADLAPHGIRVNAVCPGQIESTMMAALFETRASENGTSPTLERSAFIERIPLGELGSVEDVARAYRYFSSDASGYVTGQHLIVDGGWQVG